MTRMMRSDSSRPYIIIGGGGHAKVLIDMLQEQECNIIGYTEMIDKKAEKDYDPDDPIR